MYSGEIPFLLQTDIRGRSKWGAWGTNTPPPSGLSKHETWRFITLNAHSYSNAVHISLYESLLYILQTQVLKTAALKRQICGNASNTKPDSEGKRLREVTI